MVSTLLTAAAIVGGIGVACIVLPFVLILLVKDPIVVRKITVFMKIAPLAILAAIILAVVAGVLFLLA